MSELRKKSREERRAKKRGRAKERGRRGGGGEGYERAREGESKRKAIRYIKEG